MPLVSDWDFVPGDLDDSPQLASLSILRATLPTVALALIQAHPSIVGDDLETHVERSADNILRLADRLRLAVDSYRVVLARAGRDKHGLQVD
jgi:hypothetical protein